MNLYIYFDLTKLKKFSLPKILDRDGKKCYNEFVTFFIQIVPRHHDGDEEHFCFLLHP